MGEEDSFVADQSDTTALEWLVVSHFLYFLRSDFTFFVANSPWYRICIKSSDIYVFFNNIDTEYSQIDVECVNTPNCSRL